MRTALRAKAWNWQMGPEWAEKPLVVQVAPAEASQAESPQLAVAAAELEDRVAVAVPAQVAAVVPAQVAVVA